MNGNADAPQKQTFLLANGAKLELMPQKAATFYMTNEPDDLKGWHKVTLTRPFWMTRTCVTVDQWREFAPNDCDDCRDVEKALDGKALLYIRLPRKSIDEFCAYLTAKYAKQLPKGYVFRLPSEAEWEYTRCKDDVVAQYGDGGKWYDFVSVGGKIVRDRFSVLRNNKKSAVLKQFGEDGFWKDHRYKVGGFTPTLPSGVIDMYGEWRWILEWDASGPYYDYEIDPLRNDKKMLEWSCVYNVDKTSRPAKDPSLSHIVLGPDLISEKAWQNKRENIGMAAAVPRQRAKFDPKKIPNKINKPREVALKRVGGKEMIFCEISKGKFNMSNLTGVGQDYHKVQLTKPFWMSKFLVTADEWREFAPADFHTKQVKIAETIFSKNPIAIRCNYKQWESYCEFLNARYAMLLPEGYVFRLPTEAEWEWAFIADEDGCLQKMPSEFFNNDKRLCDEFSKRIKSARKEIQFDPLGLMGDAYVGGRTAKTGFGVFDLAVCGWRDVWTIDTFGVFGVERETGVDWEAARTSENIVYRDKEVDPVRYAGRTAKFAELRRCSNEKILALQSRKAYAHIVIAPDILKPLREKEIAPFPKEDFGGVFLGDLVKRVDQSSKCDDVNGNNSDERLKRMLSLENVIVDRFDKQNKTAGFYTQSEDSPWILLDLGKKSVISGISIDSFGGRDGSCPSRHLCIWVSDDGKHEKLVDKEELMRKRYRIDLQKKNVKGRYIRIGREPKIEKNWFFLDKVVIYGKEK